MYQSVVPSEVQAILAKWAEETPEARDLRQRRVRFALRVPNLHERMRVARMLWVLEHRAKQVHLADMSAYLGLTIGSVIGIAGCAERYFRECLEAWGVLVVSEGWTLEAKCREVWATLDKLPVLQGLDFRQRTALLTEAHSRFACSRTCHWGRPVDARQEGAGESRSIQGFWLSPRALNCMHYGGITTLGELRSRSEQDLLRIRNLGRTTLLELRNLLAEKPVEDFSTK